MSTTIAALSLVSAKREELASVKGVPATATTPLPEALSAAPIPPPEVLAGAPNPPPSAVQGPGSAILPGYRWGMSTHNMRIERMWEAAEAAVQIEGSTD
ncbi:hypothetical protein BDZ89DRAFT_770374 [Hymenopellis radicata]|nr:hypothetical protein BDZ89DRAFT_770374 [Hymenopellis radicata]